MSVQRIVEESPVIELQSEPNYNAGEPEEPTKYQIKFEQIYLSKVNTFSIFISQMIFSQLTGKLEPVRIP